MSYFTPDVIAREQLFGAEALQPIPSVAEKPSGVAPPRYVPPQKLKLDFPVELARLLKNYLEAKLGETHD